MRAIYGFRAYGRSRTPVRIDPHLVLSRWAKGQSTYDIRWAILRDDRLSVSEAEIANFIAAYRDDLRQSGVAA